MTNDKNPFKSLFVVFFDNGESKHVIAEDMEEAIQCEKELYPEWRIISASWYGTKILEDRTPRVD